MFDGADTVLGTVSGELRNNFECREWEAVLRFPRFSPDVTMASEAQCIRHTRFCCKLRNRSEF